MSREKIPGKPHHFKAGNLNFGLEQITLLPGGSAEFVAALDADMVSCFFLTVFPCFFEAEWCD
jgi:cellulose synthase/poly-beta-1,6-N-acetylglucosamine synthase-like glycosyltransferase